MSNSSKDAAPKPDAKVVKENRHPPTLSTDKESFDAKFAADHKAWSDNNRLESVETLEFSSVIFRSKPDIGSYKGETGAHLSDSRTSCIVGYQLNGTWSHVLITTRKGRRVVIPWASIDHGYLKD